MYDSLFELLKQENPQQKDSLFFLKFKDKSFHFTSLPEMLTFPQEYFYSAMDMLESRVKMHQMGVIELTPIDAVLLSMLVQLMRLNAQSPEQPKPIYEQLAIANEADVEASKKAFQKYCKRNKVDEKEGNKTLSLMEKTIAWSMLLLYLDE